jgi:hypothetical protein
MIASICLSMISAQTRSAFVARENRFPFFRIMLYRPARYRPPGAGVRVEPLGEGLISVLPDGFRALFAPAAALPALLDVPAPGLVALPVVPVAVDPDVVPLAAAPPVDEPPPAEPPLDCANA